MPYPVSVLARAYDELNSIYDNLANAISPDAALQFSSGAIRHLQDMSDHPWIGTSRDDLRPGLRIFTYRNRLTVPFVVEDDRVLILGFYCRGPDFAALIAEMLH